jgi:hypothetical protein
MGGLSKTHNMNTRTAMMEEVERLRKELNSATLALAAAVEAEQAAVATAAEREARVASLVKEVALKGRQGAEMEAEMEDMRDQLGEKDEELIDLVEERQIELAASTASKKAHEEAAAVRMRRGRGRRECARYSKKEK